MTVNVPEQAAPVINLTVPERPLPPLEPPPGEGARPSVTEYVIFKDRARERQLDRHNAL